MKGISGKNINLATVSFPVTVQITSDVETITFYGNKTLSGNVVIQESATPSSEKIVYLLFTGAITTGVNTFTVFGTALNSDVIKQPFICVAFYTNSVWTLWYAAIRTIPVHTGGMIEVNATGGLNLVDDKITNVKINSAAAIAYTKLVLTNSVVNADIAPAAAIAYTKLALTGSVLNADINAAAAIAYTKLALTGGIVNADINASAAIAYSKLALTGSIVNADVATAAAIVYTKLNLTGSIVNADIATAAAIAYSKMAALTASELVITNASGVPISAAVATYPSLTELAYLKGVTSAIQTQINAAKGSSGTYTYSATATIVLDSAATSYYKLNTTSNAIAVTLPAAALFSAGRAITIIQVFSGGTDKVTVSPDGTDTIQNMAAATSASIVYSTTGESHIFVSNGIDSWLMMS